MDHMEQLELDQEELMLILFIIRLQNKPPKLYIESLTALAKAMRVNHSTLYRWLEALEQPREASDGRDRALPICTRKKALSAFATA